MQLTDDEILRLAARRCLPNESPLWNQQLIAFAKDVLAHNARAPVLEAPKGCHPEEWGPSNDRRLTCACGNPDPFHLESVTASNAGTSGAPTFHGFMSEDGTRVDVCFTPNSPRADGKCAQAYYTKPTTDAADSSALKFTQRMANLSFTSRDPLFCWKKLTSLIGEAKAVLSGIERDGSQ